MQQWWASGVLVQLVVTQLACINSGVKRDPRVCVIRPSGSSCLLNCFIAGDAWWALAERRSSLPEPRWEWRLVWKLADWQLRTQHQCLMDTPIHYHTTPACSQGCWGTALHIHWGYWTVGDRYAGIWWSRILRWSSEQGQGWTATIRWHITRCHWVLSIHCPSPSQRTCHSTATAPHIANINSGVTRR